jgi:hypothetical protein
LIMEEAMSPKDKVRALLHKEAGLDREARKQAVRDLLYKEAGGEASMAKRGVGALYDILAGFGRGAKAGFKGKEKMISSTLEDAATGFPTRTVHDWTRAARAGQAVGKGTRAAGRGAKAAGRFAGKHPIYTTLGGGMVVGGGIHAYNKSQPGEINIPGPEGQPTRKDPEGKTTPKKTPAGKKPEGKKPEGKGGIPVEAKAGAAGALAGAPIGYAVAPKLGLDRVTGTVGSSALFAVLAALAANRLKS